MTNADKWCFVYDIVRSYQILFYLQNEGISYRTAEYKKGYYFTDKYYKFRNLVATLVKEHIK